MVQIKNPYRYMWNTNRKLISKCNLMKTLTLKHTWEIMIDTILVIFVSNFETKTVLSCSQVLWTRVLQCLVIVRLIEDGGISPLSLSSKNTGLDKVQGSQWHQYVGIQLAVFDSWR